MPTGDLQQGVPAAPVARSFHTRIFSQNQMFSKFNALGLDNLIQQALTRGTDITSDIENRLKGP
jgi:hypothetical protein